MFILSLEKNCRFEAHFLGFHFDIFPLTMLGKLSFLTKVNGK